ncbi:1544_t:CDS:2 [Ambispora gerdemannii]|uniref:1544_t:CDS:1 n=1 Tax=Ambispora gerdemannii TaxID=144530 RepID=A0A9N8ZDX7_9GLOM|nr:1544_t:CDS:2 [Ambispora gerdemannii]
MVRKNATSKKCLFDKFCCFHGFFRVVDCLVVIAPLVNIFSALGRIYGGEYKLYFESPRPHWSVTNYGLFTKCSTINNGCRPFPSEEYGDCDEEGFCSEWRAASYDLIVSIIIGGIALLYLLFFVLLRCDPSSQRADYLVAVMFALSAFLQINTVVIVSYLKNNSFLFMYESFDLSFALASVSTGLSFVIVIFLGTSEIWARWQDVQGGYEQID